MGPLRGRRANFDCFENPDLRELLNRNVIPDAAERVIDAELSRQPTWAPGLPVKCEIQTVESYTK